MTWHYHLHLSPNRDAASACALSQITTSFQLHGIQNVEIRNFYVEANHFFVEEPEALVELKRLSHQLTLESDKQLRYQVAKSLITTTQLFIHSPIKGYSGKTVFEWIMQPWAHVIIGREEAKTLISDLLGLCCSHPKDAISSSLLPKMLQIFSQWDEESSQSVAKEYLEGLFTESAEIGYSLFPYRLTTYFIRKRLLSQKQLIELLLDPTTQHYPLSFGITAPLIDCFQMPYVSKIAFKVIENLVGAIDRSISNEVLMGLELLHDGQTYLPKTKSKEIQLWRRQLIKGRLPLQCFVNQSCSTSHSTENRQQLLGQHLYNLQDARITHQPLPAPLPESILEIDCSTTLEKALWMAIRREELSIHAYTASSVEEWAALAEEKQIGVEQPLHTILMASELLKKEVNRSCFITKESVQRWLDRLLELLDNQETNLHSEARWEWLAALATEMHKRQPYEVTSFLCLLEQYQKITRPNPVQLDHCIASLTHTQDSTPPIQHAIRLGVRRLAPNCYPMVST